MQKREHENKNGEKEIAAHGAVFLCENKKKIFPARSKVFSEKSDTISIKRVMQVKNYRLSTEAIQKRGTCYEN